MKDLLQSGGFKPQVPSVRFMPTNETIVILQVSISCVFSNSFIFQNLLWKPAPRPSYCRKKKQCLPQCLCCHNAENSGTGTGTLTTKTSFAVPILALWGNINLRVLVTIETWDIEKMYRCMNRLN